MWTSTLDLDPKRVLITQLLRPIWPAVSFSSFSPLQMQNAPRQSLTEKTWVRVRNRLGGICGSDLHMVQGDGDFRIAPAALPLHRRSYPGHEVVGEVLEIGEDVQHINVGDRVALQYGPNCLSAGVQTPCRSCAHGYYNLCEYGKLPGPHPVGGGWSEEMLLPEQQLFRLPADISDEQAVLLEPTAVAIHAVLRRLPQSGERTLIIGAGAIGLLTLQIVRALAPQAEVSVLARHSFQIEQATRMGAAHIIYPQDSYTGIQRATDAQIYKGPFDNQVLLGGYDVIFDTVGSQKTLHHALRWARAQATVVLVGISLHQMQIDLTPIWYQETNLMGSMGSSIETWPLATDEQRPTFEVGVELMQQNRIHPEHLITHRFPINNYQTALLTAAGKAQSHAIKVVFDYSLLPPSVVPNVRASAARKRHSLLSPENTSMPDERDTQVDVPAPIQTTRSASPAASLSSLLSSSRTVAPPEYDEDDELDEMEDTIPAPIIKKFSIEAPTPARQKVQDTWLEEDVTTLPTIPTMPSSPVSTTASTIEDTTPVPLIEENTSIEEAMPSDSTEEITSTENAMSFDSATDIAIPVAHPDETVNTTAASSSILPEEVSPSEDDAPQDDAPPATDTISPEEDDSLQNDAPLATDTISPEEEPAHALSATTSTPEQQEEEPSHTSIDVPSTSDEQEEPSHTSIDVPSTSDEQELETVDTPSDFDEQELTYEPIDTPSDFDEQELTYEPIDTPPAFNEEELAYDPIDTLWVYDEEEATHNIPTNGVDATSEVEDTADTETGSHDKEIAPFPLTSTESSAKLETQPDAARSAESPDPVDQQIPLPTGSVNEEETAINSATIGTENALLHTEGTPIAKTQNRPRPRTRKKNNRTSIEKR